MSFGNSASVRFENQSGRKTVVFWDKQATASKNAKISKKGSNKGHDQKYPLRKQQQNVIEAKELPPDKPLTTNRKAAPGQVTKPVANKKIEGHYGVKKKKTPETAGTVVLTQKEFDAILDTIGQLALEADKPVKQTGPAGKTARSHVRESRDLDPGVSIELTPADGVINTGATPREGPAVAKELPLSPMPQARDLPFSPDPGQQFTTNQALPPVSRTTHQLAAPVPTTTHQPAAPVPTTTQQMTAPTQRPGVTTSMDKPLSEVLSNVRGVPVAHMTKAEKKRLEWERERAAQPSETEWDPWGRPGGGAPIKDNNTGEVLTDYKTRAPDTPRQHDLSRSPGTIAPPTYSQIPHSQSPASKPPTTLTQTTPVTMATTVMSRGGMSRTTPAAVPSGAPPPPAAIRSSIVIGQAEPNDQRFESAKERQKREWLLELEKQRVEQRERKLSEKAFKQEGETYDTWADHFNSYKHGVSPPQQVAPPPPPPGGITEVARISSAPVAPPVMDFSPPQPETQHATHIRGQNVHIDPKTVQELEEKRRKQLEHQEYIRQQIEEKDRIKRIEKEKRMREEQEEEDKLRREREKLEGQVQAEKDRVRAKEEQERQRLESLRLAVEDAQLIAEREKHAKRVRKLQQAGHDTSHLNAAFQGAGGPYTHPHPPPGGMAKITPRVGAHEAAMITQNYSPRDLHTLDQSYTEASPRHDLDLSYGGGRVLTPTKFRQAGGSEPNSPRREFGIQTDVELTLPLAKELPASRESTDIVYKGPIITDRKKKKVPTATLR